MANGVVVLRALGCCRDSKHLRLFAVFVFTILFIIDDLIHNGNIIIVKIANILVQFFVLYVRQNEVIHQHVLTCVLIQ